MASDDLSIRVTGIEPWDLSTRGRAGARHYPGECSTTRGDVHSIVHHDQEVRTTKGIIWVWGARGGFAGPAEGIYRDIAEELRHEITSVRIDYRQPNVIPECVMDTLVGVSFLTGTGHTDIALVGHSFGGAVVISAAPVQRRGQGRRRAVEPDLRRTARRAGVAASAPARPRRSRHTSAPILLRADSLLGRRAERARHLPRSRTRPPRVQRRAKTHAPRLAEGQAGAVGRRTQSNRQYLRAELFRAAYSPQRHLQHRLHDDCSQSICDRYTILRTAGQVQRHPLASTATVRRGS